MVSSQSDLMKTVKKLKRDEAASTEQLQTDLLSEEWQQIALSKMHDYSPSNASLLHKGIGSIDASIRAGSTTIKI